MFKSLVLLTTFSALLFTTPVLAKEVKFMPVDRSFATRLCVLVAQGNNVVMYAKMRAFGWSLAFVRANIKCNGESIGVFAARYGNKRVRFLMPAGKVSITDLVEK